jgi:hypothetical protein
VGMTGEIRRFKRYPAYKDSGVEWLGEIPERWNVRRLKTFASVQLSNVDKKSVEGQEIVRLCNYVDPLVTARVMRALVVLRWKAIEASPEGDFFVRSGPGTVKLPAESAKEYVRTRFPGFPDSPREKEVVDQVSKEPTAKSVTRRK